MPRNILRIGHLLYTSYHKADFVFIVVFFGKLLDELSGFPF